MLRTRSLVAVALAGLAWGACDDGARFAGPDATDSPTPQPLSDYLPPPTPIGPDCEALPGFIIPWEFPDPATPPNGTYEVHEYGMSITISNASRGDFDWASTFPVASIIVQGTLTPEFYYYEDPGSLGESDVGSYRDPETNIPEDIVLVHFCYLPQLTVHGATAEATYDALVEWTLEKSVDPEFQWGYPGQDLSWTWSLAVTKAVTAESNFRVTGVFNVGNPTEADLGFTVAVDLYALESEPIVICDADAPLEEPRVYPVAAGGSVWCTYTAWVVGNAASSVHVAVASLSPDVWGTVAEMDFLWTANPLGPTSALLQDDGNPAMTQTVTESGVWTYSQIVTCSSARDDYGDSGRYSQTMTNIAVLTATESPYARLAVDSASTSYWCGTASITLLKLTNGEVNPGMAWQFALYDRPGDFRYDSPMGESTTFGDADGVLVFGDPFLLPDFTYRVCERDAPAGWSATWTMNGVAITAYNPDGIFAEPEDVGNRCFDFGHGTPYPIQVGPPTVFTVGNAYPDGDPRSASFWRSWSTCSQGNQALLAARSGGAEAGWYLLDDALVVDQVVVGRLLIDTCPLALSVLDQRDLKSGKKMASDPVYSLAMQVLTARLNFAAGAYRRPYAEIAVEEAQVLLDGIRFDGTGGYLRPRDADYAAAVDLVDRLARYNSGTF